MNTQDLIKKLCNENNISIHKLEIDLNFSNGSLTKSNSLSFDRVVLIANYFGVSLDFFVDQTTKEPKLSKEESAIITAYRRVGEETKNNICLILGVKRDIESKTVSASNE